MITELLCTRLVAALNRGQGEEETEILFEIVHDDEPLGPAYAGSVPAPSHHRRKMRTLLEELLNLAGGVGGVID